MKVLRKNLTYGLILIVIVLLFFISDRYLFNPSTKGISPVDIKNVVFCVILPLIGLIILIRVFERFKEKK